MLKNVVEREIISRARQKNVRDYNRSAQHFVNIFQDFFGNELFKDAVVLDMGPGHYDFGVMARERGATEVVGVDNDPAVLELGRYKQFTVVEGRLQELDAEWFEQPFDGIFCKFSLNCFWFWPEDSLLVDHIGRIASTVCEDGWAWIAPWNGAPKKFDITKEEIVRFLDLQARTFIEFGFDACYLTVKEAKRYGINGAVENNVVFTKNLL